MTYRLVVPPSIRRQIEKLPLETQRALHALFRDLREDPDRHSGPYGLEDDGPVRMRSAGRAGAIAVVLISDLSVTVTVVSVQTPLAD
ncbi:type II toxin-antitoxin system RelE/ParE family toxin [Streptomyces sp. NPDC017529]|uniref:type II toxin-antitoxin system RelE/ParE family toxin n=1 Tax=Streptomyces sp. NPDC017529 TaxID=3365000 RepID=UPI00379C2631